MLRDPQKKETYDQFGKAGLQGGAPPEGAEGGPHGSRTLLLHAPFPFSLLSRSV